LKSPYWIFNTNTWNFNCNTGNFRKKYGENRAGKARKLLKKRDFLMESPAPLLQRYNIFDPKARNVKMKDGRLAACRKGDCGLAKVWRGSEFSWSER